MNSNHINNAMFSISLESVERTGKSRYTVPRVTMEFHVAKKVRDKYGFDESFFSITGNVILARFHDVRIFAYKMNQQRDLIKHPEQAIKVGELNAMGLIDEILHYIIYLYRQEVSPKVMGNGLSYVIKNMGEKEANKALFEFMVDFPPVAVYKNEMTPEEYFNGTSEGVPNKEVLLEEMLMLWVANMNPAFSVYKELFDSTRLESATKYLEVIDHLHVFFDEQKHFGPDNQNLIDMIRTPAIVVPNSLQGQLEFMVEKWGMLLGKFLFRILSSLDLIKEEMKMRGFGKPQLEAYDYSHENEYERFSMDKDWMPKCVLMAKHTLVWLDQLSKKFGREIKRLDQIPDEELDTLARWGFTGLWLIGLWERSAASKLIKQHCGNPDAESSAYSLYDYIIAGELGGWDALHNLKDRCWQRGIRLASDMVPNHTGIYSKWMVEHPDWFVQLDYPPFPSYSFSGHNYSHDSRIGLFIEDHYYSRSDAAVVFKRVDFQTGQTRYIYHGNDGTNMPWNDTAQLNFLNPEVREAVINTIIHAAKSFPIIRFDAAMTLTKKHYQRLWFPVPGSGGDIPSRAEHGMDKKQFNDAIPNEFWREVVDRVAAEVPDTLLLAEAFWLMEGYFVRTLGMHRVYNSAFMNMLKTEDNQKYRLTIKNTMEFDPDILKRFVNFQNNPDEDTAVAQFGKDDKYFGVCILMATMPGLPMFGHGQIEGMTEKYGMEYRRAYWDETPDQNLIERHEHEIFPLLRKRYLFSQVTNFLMYDFYAPEGWVNENVFAYSNRIGLERGLVLYNNKYDSARGWIRVSSGFAEKTADGKRVLQRVLGEGLALHSEWNYFAIFRDHITGLEYIRSCKQIWESGLYIELGAFKYHVFIDFREVCDNEFGHYAKLHESLHGSGVASVDEELKEIFLKPIFLAFKQIINPETFIALNKDRLEYSTSTIPSSMYDSIQNNYAAFLKEIKTFLGADGDEKEIARIIRLKLETVQKIERISDFTLLPHTDNIEQIIAYIDAGMYGEETAHILYAWVFLHATGKIINGENSEDQSRSWIDEWLFGKKTRSVLAALDVPDPAYAIDVIKILTIYKQWFVSEETEEDQCYNLLRSFFNDHYVQNFVGVNRYNDVLWFNRERFDLLMWWIFIVSVIDDISEGTSKHIPQRFAVISKCLAAEQQSDYQVEKLIEASLTAKNKVVLPNSKTREKKGKK
jgi:glycosidase